MNAMTIHFAESALVVLAYSKIEIDKLPEELGISEEEVCDVLRYLKKIEAVQYTSLLSESLQGFVGVEVTAKGLEIACQKRPLVDVSQNVSQHVTNSHIHNLVQSSGNSNVITQIVDNSKHYILKQIIEQDQELDSANKKKLFNILGKFNTLKESGENAFELLKTVGTISLKYVPLFFALLR